MCQDRDPPDTCVARGHDAVQRSAPADLRTAVALVSTLTHMAGIVMYRAAIVTRILMTWTAAGATWVVYGLAACLETDGRTEAITKEAAEAGGAGAEEGRVEPHAAD